MDTGEVKIKSTGTGHNGIRQMTYARKVADFNTFIKSPDKFTKPTSEKNDDKLHPQGSDKDYKQLFAKIKYVGEQITALTNAIAKDPSKAKALNEAMTEMAALNKKLLEFVQPGAQLGDAGGAEGGYKAKIQGKIDEFVQGIPNEKLEQVAMEIEQKIGGKSPEEVQSMIEPNEPEAQEVLNQAKTEMSVEESLIVEGFPSFSSAWIKKFVDTILGSIAGAGIAATIVASIVFAATEGHPGRVFEIIGEFGGISAFVSFVLMGVSSAIQRKKEKQGL